MGRTMTRTIRFAGIGFLALCTSALADMDWQRMKRDLAIQESILDRFLDAKKGATIGLYAKNYGVLLIDRGWPQTLFFERKKDDVFDKKRIAEFLGTYSNAIGQLKDDDRVTVLLYASKIDMPDPDSKMGDIDSLMAIEIDSLYAGKDGLGMEATREAREKMAEARKKMVIALRDARHQLSKMFQGDREGSFFEATVTKRDIDAYNRGKIDGQTFQNRIAFSEREPQPARDKKIDIMTDILSGVIQREGGADFHFLSGAKSAGLYQKGIGAIFLVSQQNDLIWYDWKMKNKTAAADRLDALKTAVIETLADYGPTLRDLPAEESIIVHADIAKDADHKIARIVREKKDKTPEVIAHPDRLIFRVTKRDIDAYASEKIDLDTFRQRVEITEM